MFRADLVASRPLRCGLFGFGALVAAITFTTPIAEARHYRHHHHVRHFRSESHESYSPAFSAIIVDGNSGATLSSTSPDGSRHPASLTKIMTLYLLFERLEAGKMKLDTEMPVSEHAAEQAPTKLGLQPGQTIRVEDAIKGLVTRSANDAAVVIAETLGGDEDNFAKLMTRKARMLGMTKTVYRNASGLPDDEQVTTARDQSTLGRAIQDRFPRYYRYFSTTSFTFRGHSITNHNHLLGTVEGVDGIKTGYTRDSGFNLVTSMRRGNRHLVGVVMGGHSGSSRDAIMRGLLAENLEKASTRRTVAAITERNPSDTKTDVAAIEAPPRPAAASLMPQPKAEPQPKADPAPLTSGVIQTQPIAAIPGSSEPMKPVKVKTIQIKAGQVKLAAIPAQPAPPIASDIPGKAEIPDTSNAAIVAKTENDGGENGKSESPKPETNKPETNKTETIKTETTKPETNKTETIKTETTKADTAKSEISRLEPARADWPPQPPNHGSGNGILGVLPASSLPSASPAQALAYADASPRASMPKNLPPSGPSKPEITHSGWIIQVGALESEGEAHQRLEAARSQAHGLLNKADPFTESVVAKGERKLFRARFAGLDREQAEAACHALKRGDISCITIRN